MQKIFAKESLNVPNVKVLSIFFSNVFGFLLLKNIGILATIVFILHKNFLFLGKYALKICIYFNESNAICLVKSNMISELKEKTAKVRKLFKGGNYSREETI